MGHLRGIIACAAILAAVSCAPRKKTADSFKPLPFPSVNAPAMMEPQDKLDYILSKYWDGILDPGRDYPCDSLLVSGVKKSDVEQAMANYSVLLAQVELGAASRYVTSFTEKLIACEKAKPSSEVFESISHMYEHYLFDPNSPVRDEDLYTPYAKVMAGCELVPEAKRSVYAEDVRMTSLNRRGTKACDFSFSTAAGKIYHLDGIKADHTILFFSNPGCAACKDIISTLSSDPMVSSLIASKSVAVLNIYIDEDLKEWYDYMSIYPTAWYNGYDHNHLIRDNELYNVRAIPSLYLLDAKKNVIFKDTEVDRVINYFQWQQ